MSEHASPNQDSTDEPKLIIDEDWKSQVQREKEMLKQQKDIASEPQEGVGSNQPSSEPSQDEDGEQPRNELDSPPPANFEYLVSGLATQAVAAMGQLPDAEGNPLPVSLDYARHYIDLLGVIETKTKGNLDDRETRFLQDTLHQLRLIYVEVANT